MAKSNMAASIQALAMRAGLFAALLCAGGALHAACPNICVTVDSVVHAAGVPPDMAKAAQRIVFDGDKLSDLGVKATADLAKQMKLLSGNAVAKLKVSADSGVSPAAAKAQVAARRAALAAALGQAGLPATRFQISAD